MNEKIKFFLGANSYNGFISYFKQLQELDEDLQLFFLKGGPGSGKSSLMKRVAACAEDMNNKIEYIYCAGDPDSLDAFIDRKAGLAMVDGTSPHVEDPMLPGALQHIIYTGDGWNTEKLFYNRKNIAQLEESISGCHSSACAYIGAAASLIRENMKASQKYIDKTKLYPIVKEIADLCGYGRSGKETKRLLSAVTVEKVVFFDCTIRALADKIYVINDEWGSAAAWMLESLSRELCGKGVDYISCRCSVLPERIEHIIIPSAGVAVVTANEFHSISGEKEVDGLYGGCLMSDECKKRQEIVAGLIKKACGCVSDAKLLHDALESFYVKAMDFSRVEEKYLDILKRFY